MKETVNELLDRLRQMAEEWRDTPLAKGAFGSGYRLGRCDCGEDLLAILDAEPESES